MAKIQSNDRFGFMRQNVPIANAVMKILVTNSHLHSTWNSIAYPYINQPLTK